MSSNSKIEWTDKTWNPVTGCTKISQGCKHCYAETFYERFNGKGSFKNVTCHKDRLEQPLKWKKPSMIFVNSMSDLFHESVPFSFIYEVYLIMQKAQWHVFQVLTKRAERMLQFYNEYAQIADAMPNVWVGVSVEDQQSADLRLPLLLKTPAAIRFLSCEPLIGEVDFYTTSANGFPQDKNHPWRNGPILQGIDWVICGGESGHGARPMHPDWARKLRDQCLSAKVPFFFKQWGQWAPHQSEHFDHYDFGTFVNEPGDYDAYPVGSFIPGIKGMNWGTAMSKLGKKKAGRLLDGQLHDDFPVSS